MNKNQDIIMLGHGSGGRLTHDLIKNLFYKYFSNQYLSLASDATPVPTEEEIAVSTDSYVVDPIFFPGGNIGKLAVAGTVNDVAVTGAKPLYITAAFIIEEGFLLCDLETIVASMAEEANKAGVYIIAGDTKVVERGKCDKVFITTTGIGSLEKKYADICTGKNISAGDVILINGYIGDHGMTIMSERNQLNIKVKIQSDCACLNKLISETLNTGGKIKFMRDATRGGLATVLKEISEISRLGIEINEPDIPVREPVKGVCELLGFDPLYVANEGKVVMIVAPEDTEKILSAMKKNELGVDAKVIGKVTDTHPGKAVMCTLTGGGRIIDMLSGDQLPRIC